MDPKLFRMTVSTGEWRGVCCAQAGCYHCGAGITSRKRAAGATCEKSTRQRGGCLVHITTAGCPPLPSPLSTHTPGAPPDYFDPNGQNWGFPTYNWCAAAHARCSPTACAPASLPTQHLLPLPPHCCREEMAKDGYLWWRRRLTHMAQYFHAYRIDHILGFFRIWEVRGCGYGGPD